MDPRGRAQQAGRAAHLIHGSALLALAALLCGAERAPPDFFPCTPGLTLEYEIVQPGAAAPPTRMVETVRGPGKEPATCVLDRRVSQAGIAPLEESWVREVLPRRVSNAGWERQPTAFRAPFLVAPVEAKRRWRFNTTRYEIEATEVEVTVPAGTFQGCVIVREASEDGLHEARSVYAPALGLVQHESRTRRMHLVRLRRPPVP